MFYNLKSTLKKIKSEIKAYSDRYKSLNKTDGFSYYPVSKDPPIYFVYVMNSLAPLFRIASLGKERGATFIVMFWWTLRKPYTSALIRYQLNIFLRKYPGHQVVFSFNDSAERDALGDLPIKTIIFNQNALLDENVFRVLKKPVKIFDAVYNARMAAYKRLELAASVRGLAIITSPYNNAIETEYFYNIKRLLSHAKWLNFDENWNYVKLSESKVCEIYNQSRIGLILSCQEGACYAATEYLLCGLPVVSTKSIGGRDAFFLNDYVEIVEDNPVSVMEAVARLIKKDLDPEYIRKKTIEGMLDHRKKVITLLNEISGEFGYRINFEVEWPKIFTNKMKLTFDKEKHD